MTEKTLFDAYGLGGLPLANSIVMAPLTRNCAGAGFMPSDLAATYYAQRASACLIITEATPVSAHAQGYQDTPGLYSPEQIAGWRQITDAVHATGAKVFVQLWHVGPVSHVSVQPGGAVAVAPSAIRAQAKTFVNNNFVDVSEPSALALEEIPDIVESFRQAAANAIAAGFDGVEVHGANGYLLDQFLRETANVRTDAYGGSFGNRARLLIEATTAVCKAVGARRTGVRISTVSPVSGIGPSVHEQPQFKYVAEQLNCPRHRLPACRRRRDRWPA